MQTLMIVPRWTSPKPPKKHDRRFIVRYRLGGRGWPLVHAGSFRTEREAKERLRLVAGEIAAGRDPAQVLRHLATPAPAARTFAAVAADHQASRIDVSDGTQAAISVHLKALLPTFGMMRPDAITPADVQRWITTSTLKPITRRQYVGTLRLILDHAECEPNPARHRSIRFPASSTRSSNRRRAVRCAPSSTTSRSDGSCRSDSSARPASASANSPT